MPTMNKSDLADAIQYAVKMTKRDAIDTLDELFGVVMAALARGESLTIANFGKFEVRQKDARTGRNPQTGEPITIERRRVVVFRASPRLRAQVNDGSHLDTIALNRWRASRAIWKQEDLPL